MSEDFQGILAIVYNTDIKKWLLISNRKTGNITFPGGGKEDTDKTSIDCLKREIKEELGLFERDYSFEKTKIIYEFVYNGKKIERIGQKVKQIVYLVKTSKQIFNSLDKSVDFLGWFDESELLNKLTFNDHKEIFKKAIEI